MANITTLSKGSTLHSTSYDGPRVYTVDNIINFASALTAKGSALASSDTIEALVIPPGTFVLQAGLQTILADDATTLTLDLGYTGGDVDFWVDGYDQAAAAAGDYSTWSGTTAAAASQDFGTTADTIDLLFATLTGTLTIGKVRVWAAFIDKTGGNLNTTGIARVGS